MLVAVTPSPKKKPVKSSKPAEESFPEAFEKLLRAKKIPVPKGLKDAPPAAYASQDASFVEQMAKLPPKELKRYAEQVAGYAARQAERVRLQWETSPLIAELRRRKLKEPQKPVRPTGASVSLTKPLGEWTDKQLLKAANDWSKRGS